MKSRHREPKAGGGGGAAVRPMHPSAWAVALEVQVQEQMVSRGPSAPLYHILSCFSDLNTCTIIPMGSGGSFQGGGGSRVELGQPVP